MIIRGAILLCLVLTGCVSSRIEQSRSTVTGIDFDEAMVILGRASYSDRETKVSFTDCIESELSTGKTAIRLIPQNQFKDDLYPWFEPRTAPTSASDLSRLFAEPGVRARIDEAKVRYLAWIEGDTLTTDRGGSMSCTLTTFGGGCFGMSYWEQDASYQASIWDVKQLTTAGKISADASGTSYIAGLVIPIPIIARPGNAACKGLAAQLREFILDGS
ncbi:MAG: hypothetical protein ACJ0Q6_08180 [Candidatus Azotimanducaceae bacterium]|uniref:Lipoprotein n=1 Tax=OM182 bacterium TaxID=2510334 RepID=A0A520S4E2_9GAMM|nr:hypothetical protein [Gammaproteobacteria bacterium]OUV68209.1 MAG: hypothetical protein CBC93_02460 [Gammaproteobacteria bacterium TMED133]RZO77301.1 MAG: hypothetical protein EVA68_01555 [OM182 bacterium]